MSDTNKGIIWTSALTKKLCKLKFENEWLFKKKRQPYQEFHKILLANGFPSYITAEQMRTKWRNIYDAYKAAKKAKHKKWKYYELFEKQYGQKQVFDRFEAWPDEWREKFVDAITEAKGLKLEKTHLWRFVEKTLRSQGLPAECCVQEMKALWDRLVTTFRTKYRKSLMSGYRLDWPLYDKMLNYSKQYEDITEKFYASDLDTQISEPVRKYVKSEFVWTRDITETFIQIRLQNDMLFRERSCAWSDLCNMMIKEHGFPKTINASELSRKWSCIILEYQKAQATNNTAWIYYNIFESYYAAGNFTLNPLSEWDEEWVFTLIRTRTEFESAFVGKQKRDSWHSWRAVETSLRRAGLPLNCSLLDLQCMWDFLVKSFTWRKKYKDKGELLHNTWPYYDAMQQYFTKSMLTHRGKNAPGRKVKHDVMSDHVTSDHATSDHATSDHATSDHVTSGHETSEYATAYDVEWDDDDDVKLLDLKKKSEFEPKIELAEALGCRTCTQNEGCVDIYETRDNSGIALAEKINILCGVQINKSENLPEQICLSCVADLERAFKFRERCLMADKEYRNSHTKHGLDVAVKIEVNLEEEVKTINMEDNTDYHEPFDTALDISYTSDIEPTKKKKLIKRETKKKTVKYKKYAYNKVCEICGKHTPNLKAHLDSHSTRKEYSCNICNAKFKFRSSMQLHKSKHDPQPKKTCEVCGKSFSVIWQYKRHFVYHSNKREFACETCGKRFNTSDILKVHSRVHTDERPFTCSECGKTFRTAGCVSRHKRIVHKSKTKLPESSSTVQ